MPKNDGLVDPRLGSRLIAEARLTRDEQRIERAIKKALAIHKIKALAALRAQHLTAAAPVDAFSFVSWDASVDDEVLPLLGTVLNDLATSTASFLRLPPEVRAQLLGQIDVQARTQVFADKVRTIGTDIAGRLTDELQVGVAQGESIPQLIKRVDEVFEIGDNIAERIARTETHGAAEATVFTSAGAISNAGFDVTKEWVAAIDSRTREAHADADGQIVDINDAFDVDGEALMFPGDPDGSPDNTINCRCSTVYSQLDSGDRSDTPDPNTDNVDDNSSED